MVLKPAIISSVFAIAFLGCKKESTKCVSTPIHYLVRNASPCLPDGSITILSPVGEGYQYKFGYANFRSVPKRDSMVVDWYEIIVRSPIGCEDTITVRIDSIPQVRGSLFLQTKSILANNCSPCHFRLHSTASLNWGEDCTIIRFWHNIQTRAVLGLSPMPPTGLISQAERNKIMEWIKAGHRLTD